MMHCTNPIRHIHIERILLKFAVDLAYEVLIAMPIPMPITALMKQLMVTSSTLILLCCSLSKLLTVVVAPEREYFRLAIKVLTGYECVRRCSELGSDSMEKFEVLGDDDSRDVVGVARSFKRSDSSNDVCRSVGSSSPFAASMLLP